MENRTEKNMAKNMEHETETGAFFGGIEFFLCLAGNQGMQASAILEMYRHDHKH